MSKCNLHCFHQPNRTLEVCAKKGLIPLQKRLQLCGIKIAPQHTHTHILFATPWVLLLPPSKNNNIKNSSRVLDTLSKFARSWLIPRKLHSNVHSPISHKHHQHRIIVIIITLRDANKQHILSKSQAPSIHTYVVLSDFVRDTISRRMKVIYLWNMKQGAVYYILLI